MADVKMSIVKEIGVIKESENSKIVFSITEVNGDEKYDIRNYYKKKDDKDWQIGKGIRLSKEELDTLVKLVKKIK